jgi:hypothetical protein
VWFGLGVCSAFAVAVRPAYPFSGIIVTGWAAAVAVSVVSAWLAWNLYRQRALAWKAAVAWLLLNWVSVLISMKRMNLLEMYQRMGYTAAEIKGMMTFVKYAVYSGWTLGLIFFAFVIAMRKHFTESKPVLPLGPSGV